MRCITRVDEDGNKFLSFRISDDLTKIQWWDSDGCLRDEHYINTKTGQAIGLRKRFSKNFIFASENNVIHNGYKLKIDIDRNYMLLAFQNDGDVFGEVFYVSRHDNVSIHGFAYKPCTLSNVFDNPLLLDTVFDNPLTPSDEEVVTCALMFHECFFTGNEVVSNVIRDVIFQAKVDGGFLIPEYLVNGTILENIVPGNFYD